MIPRLETMRLILRQFAPTDWDAVEAMLSDPVTTRFMHFATWTEGQRRQWFDGCVANKPHPLDDPDAFYWAIVQKDLGEMIGWFGIGTSTDAEVPGERRFGYLLNRRCWNQGYMTEVLSAVLAEEIGIRAAPRLSATCDVANLASARVMEKAGMRREKTTSDTDVDGKPAQHHHYAITKAEFEAGR
jgi:ribosomal-protein-alanine N-acetyltransferase